MMEMDLHLAPGGLAERCERGEKVGIVLFDRIEKRVFGGVAVDIPERRDELREAINPTPDAAQGPLLVGVVKWLEMIADGDEEMSGFARGGATSEEIGQEPFIEGAHGNDGRFEAALRNGTGIGAGRK